MVLTTSKYTSVDQISEYSIIQSNSKIFVESVFNNLPKGLNLKCLSISVKHFNNKEFLNTAGLNHHKIYSIQRKPKDSEVVQ
jgi:hypothetical protein